MKFSTSEPIASRVFGTIRAIEIETTVEQIDVSSFGSPTMMIPGLSRTILRIETDGPTLDVQQVWQHGGMMRFDEVIREYRFQGDIILTSIDVLPQQRTTIEANGIGTFECSRADEAVLIRQRVREIRSQL